MCEFEKDRKDGESVWGGGGRGEAVLLPSCMCVDTKIALFEFGLHTTGLFCFQLLYCRIDDSGGGGALDFHLDGGGGVPLGPGRRPDPVSNRSAHKKSYTLS